MFRQWFRIAFIGVCLLALSAHAMAQDVVTAKAVTDKSKVAVGEPLILQVQVQGTDKVEPDQSLKIDGTLTVYGGGQARNQVYTSNINGRMQRTELHGYIYTYRLLPLKEGALVIPALPVKADGKVILTRPMRINVTPSQVNSNFHVTMEMKKNTAYVGEEIPCKLTVYFDKQIDDPWIYVPEFMDPAFRVDEIPVDQPDRSHVKLMLNNQISLGKVSQKTYNGREYYALELTRYLQPLRAGVFSFDHSLASFNMLAGYKSSRRNNAFGGMFDDDFFNDPFFNRRQPVMQRAIASTEPVSLTVLQLPAGGKPVNFSGLVGQYSIAAKIEPAQASVGQPMTMTVMVAGDEYMKNMQLPDLNLQAEISRNFKISTNNADGKMVAGVKVFTMTVRAKNADVKEFPPIELSYFNTSSGNYDTALSKPLPLTITAAKKVTLNDVEGISKEAVSNSEKIESSAGGIRHNYSYAQGEENSLDKENLWQSPGFILLVALPPALYVLVVLGQVIARQRDQTSDARKASGAFRVLRSAINDLGDKPESAAKLLMYLQEYFASRFGLTAATISYPEILPLLNEKNVSLKTLENLKKVFDHLEACRYGGGVHAQTVSGKFVDGTLLVQNIFIIRQ